MAYGLRDHERKIENLKGVEEYLIEMTEPLDARAIADKAKSGKLEIVINQFAPKRARTFYLYYPQRSQVSAKASSIYRASEDGKLTVTSTCGKSAEKRHG